MISSALICLLRGTVGRSLNLLGRRNDIVVLDFLVLLFLGAISYGATTLLAYRSLPPIRARSLIPTIVHVSILGGVAGFVTMHGSLVDNADELILVGALLSLASIDLQTGYVPNTALVPLALLAGFHVAFGEHRFSDMFAAMLLGGAGIALHLIGEGASFGLGDVKLLGLIGCVRGAERGLSVLGTAFVIGALIAVALIAARRCSRKDAVPFVPMICLAVLWQVGVHAV